MKGNIDKVYYTNIRDISRLSEYFVLKVRIMIPFPNKKYQIIYADPPWRFKIWSKKGSKKSPPYECQGLEWIKNLPVQNIADENCVLFLWVTFPFLEVCFDVIRAWDFEYATTGFTWIKTTKTGKYHYGLGYWTRANPEICLIFKKGEPKRIDKSIPNLVVSQVREHSRKPDEVRNRIVELMGDLSRIELFARERVEGWDAWGDEV